MAEPTISSRQRMLDRARERFPDRTFADLDATEPQEGVADLDDAIDEMLEDFSSRQAVYDENDNKLKNLLVSDPSSAEFIQRWVETGDPRTALVETFGDELGMSEESAAGFKDQLDSWRKRRDESEAADLAASSNYHDKSLPALDAWGDKKGLSLEQKRDVMVRLIDLAARGAFDGIYTEDDFNMVWNAMNHDNDVASARAQGEVEGRNARIAARRRDRSMAGSMPPTAIGGQGAVASEPQPKKRSFWGEVNNNR